MSCDVVVVCAWFNRAQYISDTVESLLAQDFDNYRIIIVNDGSTDPNVKRIFDSYSDARLRIVHQENQGFTFAIKKAITLSDAPYIAIQGAGDISLPNRLSKQYQVLSSSDAIAVVGCRRSIVPVFEGKFGPERMKNVPDPWPAHESVLYESNPFSQGEVMFRRSVYDCVGGYRTFFTYAQDRDLWCRMGQHGSFHVVGEHLYQRRHFIEDGVGANPKKLILQKKLSTFARQCFFDRDSSGSDYVDKFGHLAAFFRRPSREARRKFTIFALKKIEQSNDADARLFLDAAWSEGFDARLLFSQIVYCIRGVNFLKRFVFWLVGARIRTDKDPTVWKTRE